MNDFLKGFVIIATACAVFALIDYYFVDREWCFEDGSCKEMTSYEVYNYYHK